MVFYFHNDSIRYGAYNSELDNGIQFLFMILLILNSYMKISLFFIFSDIHNGNLA